MTPTKQNCSECQFEKGHALICSQFEIPVKENQEKEFDNMTPTNKENWEKDFWEIVEELGTGGSVVCFQKIRDFIRQDFISREKVEEMIEGMKKDGRGFDLEAMARGGSPHTIGGGKEEEIYNQALSDLRQKL